MIGYLLELFYVDPNIFSSVSSPSEAAQLSHFSVDFFVLHPDWAQDEQGLYAANCELLNSQNELLSERQKLSREISSMRESLQRSEKKIRTLEANFLALQRATELETEQYEKQIPEQSHHPTKSEDALQEAERLRYLRREVIEAEQKAGRYATERDGFEHQLLTQTEKHVIEPKSAIAQHSRRTRKLIMELKPAREENMRFKLERQRSQGNVVIENAFENPDTDIPYCDPNDIPDSCEPIRPNRNHLSAAGNATGTGLRAQSPASLSSDQYFNAHEISPQEYGRYRVSASVKRPAWFNRG